MVNEPMNPFEEEIKADEQVATDPFALTRAASEEAAKSWRQMLIDNHAKRQAENKKRVRNAQILGIGKALGDLAGALWGGLASSKNNAPAVVPQAQASQTAQQIEKLINEGVVNARDYDNMMVSLAMQEGRDKVNLAKAEDELKLREKAVAAQQEFAKSQAKAQRDFAVSERKASQEFQANQAKAQRDFAMEQAKRERDFRLNLASIQEQEANRKDKKTKFTNGELAILAAISSTFPETITESSDITDPLTQTTKNVATTKQFIPDDKAFASYLLKEKGNMLKYGLDPAIEEDQLAWAKYRLNSNAIESYMSNLDETSKMDLNKKIIEAFKAGYELSDIIAAGVLNNDR